MDFLDNDNNDNKELMQIFQTESEEIVERLYNNLFALEKIYGWCIKETPRNRGTKRGIRITAHTSPKTVRRAHFIKLTAFSYQPDKDSPMRRSY